MKFSSLIIISILLFACNNEAEETTVEETPEIEEEALVNEFSVLGDEGYYGEAFDESIAVDITEMEAAIGKPSSADMVVTGVVTEVCQKKGCWMKVQNGDQETRVTFKDYQFFMPFDITGKQVVMAGTAAFETTSVEDLKHFAEDGGQPQEEIDAITEPLNELTFEATGVKIQ